jgi:hypothetical protein
MDKCPQQEGRMIDQTTEGQTGIGLIAPYVVQTPGADNYRSCKSNGWSRGYDRGPIWAWANQHSSHWAEDASSDSKLCSVQSGASDGVLRLCKCAP